jgi:hypothetical protein
MGFHQQQLLPPPSNLDGVTSNKHFELVSTILMRVSGSAHWKTSVAHAYRNEAVDEIYAYGSLYGGVAYRCVRIAVRRRGVLANTC